MTGHPRTDRARTSGLVVILALLATLGLAAAPSQAAAAPLTVAQAAQAQDGSIHTVRGWVVGQPTATSTVIRSGFPNDYAIAIADDASTTSTSSMLYVQIPSALRSQWGLQSNPALLGEQVDVTGALSSYFSHAGMTGTTAVAASGSGGGGGGGTEPPPSGESPWDDTYYAPAIGKGGAELKTTLHDIIDGHTELSYDRVWDALKDTDQDPGDSANVRTLYSGRSLSKTTNGGDPDDWNREHVWPQSRGDFDTSPGPGTDVHSLRPEDVTVNSERGNKDFDLGGSAVGQCTGCLSDGDSFEPPAAVRGDVARMLFYMAVRYDGGDGFADLELDDGVGASAPLLGDLSVLLEWNAADPVDDVEMRRNDRIYDTWQGNRNPFIDHPEWAASIWS
ncbi:MAG: endonuclease [Dermatophilaceae bacterium]